MEVAILVISDQRWAGEKEDETGKVLREMVEKMKGEVVAEEIVPDEARLIKKELRVFTDVKKPDLVLTAGGTGLSPRDVTPEATLEVIDREVPGIAEAIRQESRKITSHAMLSRARSGIRGRTLVINLPGSPKAVRECLEVVTPILPHAVEVLRGEASECSTS